MALGPDPEPVLNEPQLAFVIRESTIKDTCERVSGLLVGLFRLIRPETIKDTFRATADPNHDPSLLSSPPTHVVIADDALRQSLISKWSTVAHILAHPTRASEPFSLFAQAEVLKNELASICTPLTAIVESLRAHETGIEIPETNDEGASSMKGYHPRLWSEKYDLRSIIHLLYVATCLWQDFSIDIWLHHPDQQALYERVKDTFTHGDSSSSLAYDQIDAVWRDAAIAVADLDDPNQFFDSAPDFWRWSYEPRLFRYNDGFVRDGQTARRVLNFKHTGRFGPRGKELNRQFWRYEFRGYFPSRASIAVRELAAFLYPYSAVFVGQRRRRNRIADEVSDQEMGKLLTKRYVDEGFSWGGPYED